MNSRVENIEISGIRKFYNKVRNVEGAISLTLGQPDFNVPDVIKSGMKEAIDKNKTVYTENAGILELRKEIKKYLKGLDIDYNENEICITVGGSEAIFSLFISLLNEGEKVLVPNPAYPAYESVIKIAGGNVVGYELKDDFSIDINLIKKKIKEENVRYIVLSFPSNPTGAILTKENKEELVNLIREEDVIVITDEIYASIIYDEYYSVAQCKEIREKVIYISGFSKMFAATGLRIGYIACDEKIMNELMKVHQYGVSCATSIAQYGMIEGLKYALKDVEKMKDEFKKRRNYVVSRLREMGFDCVEPKGAFYVFPSIKKFNISSEEFCDRLLREEKVACVPGTAFGSLGEGFIRISYCYSIEELKLALKKIELFINRLDR